jgi:hypothetical protein
LDRRTFVLVAWLPWCLSTCARGQTWPEEYREGSFVYHADFPLTPYRPLLRSLSRLPQEISPVLAIPDSREPVHLFLFQQADTYQQYVQRHFPAVPKRRALFIKERGPGMVFAHASDAFAVDLRHETTHAVLHAALPLVPLWLDEGLAEYFEVPPSERAYGHPHLTAVRWGARWGRVPDLARLEMTHELVRLNSDDYRAAWAWVHFMLHGPGVARATLRRYLLDIRAHAPAGRLQDRLARELPSLRRSFLRHFQQWKP